ncbi:YndJ family transporter [Shimazuella kribbensis]|uniref:YndJ family transporter n=1 Tax=Shimazuella kribbensis TaxID=139808 RepID=UPI00042A6E9B|nr:YndJ family transporter [Shimazuella kribbensis]
MKNTFSKNLVISTFLWIVCIFFVNGFEKVLLIPVFLLIPVLISLIPTIKRNGNHSNYHRLLLTYHPYIAVTIGIALSFSTNMASGMLSILWTIYTLALFLYGVRRFMERGGYVLEENAVDTSFLHALFGGITLSVYCFTEDKVTDHILLTTTLYLFFTAILSNLFIGLLGRVLPLDRRIGTGYRWTVKGIMISTLVVGIGMLTTNSWAQNIGLWIYTLCMITYCLFVFFHMEKKNFITNLCIRLSALTLVATSILAIINGVFQLQGYTWINPEQWLWYHEIPIAVGFTLGIFGWYYRKPIEKNNLYQLPQTNINGESYIGNDFLQRNGYEDQIVSHAGIVSNLEKFKRSDLIIDLLHPKVISFLENTALYDVSIQARWAKSAWLFEKFHKAYSNKIQQSNIPSPHEGIIQLDSKIVSVINHEQYWNRKLNAWVCSYKNTGETYITGIYSDHEHNGERYIHFTMPIPKFNRATIYRLEHGVDGSLQITSVPRRGGTGDEGHYIMTKNFSIRFPFNENFLIWIDEYGRLQVTHRFWFFGVKVLNIEYEMIAK